MTLLVFLETTGGGDLYKLQVDVTYGTADVESIFRILTQTVGSDSHEYHRHNSPTGSSVS